MNQMMTFLTIMLGTMLMFSILGLLPDSSITSTIVNSLKSPEKVQTTGLYAAISLALLAASATVVFGFYMKNSELAIMIPIGRVVEVDF